MDFENPLREYVEHEAYVLAATSLAAAIKKEAEDGEAATIAVAIVEEVKKSKHVERILEKCQQTRVLDPHIEEQFGGGGLLACISSQLSQCGRVEGKGVAA